MSAINGHTETGQVLTAFTTREQTPAAIAVIQKPKNRFTEHRPQTGLPSAVHNTKEQPLVRFVITPTHKKQTIPGLTAITLLLTEQNIL